MSYRSVAASKSVRHLKQQGKDPTSDAETPSGWMTVQDARTTLEVVGSYDDGGEETLDSKELAVKATLKGIGILEAIENVHLNVTLPKKDEAAELPFSRAWTVPIAVLHLSSGRLSLKNIKFLVADYDCAMVS